MSIEIVLKSQYQKAIYILNRIAKNTVDERDEKYLAKCRAVVEEYNNKCLEKPK